jgi:hypothetical protein
VIRPFRLWDAALVARLQRQGVSLDLETHLTRSRSPLGTAIVSHLLLARDGACTCIADHKEENGSWLGLAQMHQRPGRTEYVISFMSPALSSGSGAHATWQRLLAHLSVRTGECGGQRLYAGLPGEGEEYQIFRHMGFIAFAQEEVYQCADPARLSQTAPLPLRRQRARDSWGLQRLYANVTPRPVQNAEGSGQGEWELTYRPWLACPQQHGYVWESSGEIGAALQIRSTAAAHWVRLLLHPDMMDQANAVIAAVGLVNRTPGQKIYWAVRTYEAGIPAILGAHGFQLIGNQTLVVKHCTIWAREAALQPVPALNGKAERAASVKYHKRLKASRK